MIYVECKPDEALVRLLMQLSRKEVVHELKGKPQVAYKVSRRQGCVGLVDEDPGAIQPKYFQQLRAEEFPPNALRALHDDTSNNKVVMLCPRLEEWIIRASHNSKIRLDQYDLPDDPKRLHRVINDDISKLERLLHGLSGSTDLVALRRLLSTG